MLAARNLRAGDAGGGVSPQAFQRRLHVRLAASGARAAFFYLLMEMSLLSFLVFLRPFFFFFLSRSGAVIPAELGGGSPGDDACGVSR